jgi:fatty-acyl-CoA synthase
MLDPARLAPLVAAVARHAQRRGDAPALQGDAVALSRAQLLRRALQAAAALTHRWRLAPGERIAYLGANEPDFIALLLGCAESGAICTPLNWRLAPAELRAILADCTPALLLHDGPQHDAAQALHDAVPALQPLAALFDVAPPQPQEPGSISPVAEEDAVLLVYTSGTTGSPKGALHTQANLLANAQAAIAAQELTADDRVLTCLPLFHVGGLCIQTLPALIAGATVRLQPRFDALSWLREVQRWRPTLSLLVPAAMRALATHPQWPQADLSSLRAVWAGSSPLPLDLIEAFHARGVPLCNVYGATETGPFSIALPAAQARCFPGSCGWPAQGVQVRLLGPDGAVVEGAGQGEICIRAPNVAQRYWPDKAVCDAEGWFHSGDLAERHDDGRYAVVGRAKDLIISGGENIHPAEIENLLAAHPAVADVAVVGVRDAQWGEVAVACIVRRPDAPLAEEALRAALHGALQGRLARYKQPKRYVFLPALPKTALGKVRKDALRRMIDTL